MVEKIMIKIPKNKKCWRKTLEGKNCRTKVIEKNWKQNLYTQRGKLQWSPTTWTGRELIRAHCRASDVKLTQPRRRFSRTRVADWGRMPPPRRWPGAEGLGDGGVVD